MDLQKLGTALSGFGAGVQGQLPQFNAMLDQRKQREELDRVERLKAMAQDFRSVSGHLIENNPTRAITLLNNRMADLTESGTDTSSTDYVRGLIEAGDMNGAQQALSAYDREFVNQGLLDPLPQPEPEQPFTLTEGATRFAPDGSVIASNPKPEPPKDPERRPSYEDVNGVRRYEDTGEPVFPGVERDQTATNPSVNASDENTMFRMTVELLGGMVDEQGNIKLMDPTLRPKVQQITNEASQIFRDGLGNVTRAQSVSLAKQRIDATTPATRTSIPAAAIQYLNQNPSPDVIRQFEEMYKTSAADYLSQ